MEKINNSLNWFEIPVTDFERARKFYSAIFDFDMPSTIMGDYQMGFFPVEPKHIGGAIVKGKGCIPSETGALIYLNGGTDLSGVLSRVTAAGGKIELAKTQITPDLGYFSIFFDTEGNRVGLHSMQ
ncbi:MAG: VOC family protein [Cyclobacteriaceae bacterium]|nr:VOC family protein [Cyclobacteriaceae bacterium]